MTLRVLAPGLYSLVVDLGRPGTRSLGVPVGGAADRTALMLGNAHVGNPPDAPALEMTLAGPTLQADCDLACVVYGAPFVVIAGDRTIAPATTFTLHAHEVLQVRNTPHGCRAYLCVRGGFEVPTVLGSRSALEPLRAGDTLACRPGCTHGRRVANLWWQPSETPVRLRAVPGPQADWFPAGEFFAQTLRVTPASNRMGLRLHSQPLQVPPRELVSEPVCPGTVQVTRDGQCIVLGVDGQTIGGYPRVAQVIRADLDRVGQLRAGDEVAFVNIPLEEAERTYRRQESILRAWVSRLQATEQAAMAAESRSG